MLTRAQLAEAQSLAQVDAKFIAVRAGDVLAIVDQHAADERIRLERLRDQVRGTDMYGYVCMCAYIS